MRPFKFQLAVAVIAGLFTGQAAMAVELLSLRNNLVPVGDTAGIGSQTLVLLDTETGAVENIATVFDVDTTGGSPFVAIDRNPAAVESSLGFVGLTATGRLILVDVIPGEFDTFSVFSNEVALLFTEGFTDTLDLSGGAGMAFNNDSGVGPNTNLYITDGDELFLFDTSSIDFSDTFSSSSDDLEPARSAGTTVDGVLEDRNLTSLASLAGNTLFAIGDAPPTSEDTIANGETDDGLYIVEDDPFLDNGDDNPEFGALTSLDGELYPDADDTSAAFGSFYGLVIPNPNPTLPNPNTILTHLVNPNDLLRDPTLKPTIIDTFAPGALNGLIGLAPVNNAPTVANGAIPEPVTGVLGLLGLAALGAATRRRVA